MLQISQIKNWNCDPSVAFHDHQYGTNLHVVSVQLLGVLPSVQCVKHNHTNPTRNADEQNLQNI